MAIPGLLKMLKNTCEELGAPRIEAKLDDAIAALILADEFDDVTPIMDGLDSSVLNTAKRFGKARFAQVASKYTQTATALPDYIRAAVTWLMEE